MASSALPRSRRRRGGAAEWRRRSGPTVSASSTRHGSAPLRERDGTARISVTRDPRPYRPLPPRATVAALQMERDVSASFQQRIEDGEPRPIDARVPVRLSHLLLRRALTPSSSRSALCATRAGRLRQACASVALPTLPCIPSHGCVAYLSLVLQKLWT
ncbi:hypothetical protein E2562_030190 [Oryza meyeriana var. granulata]|uniref:Uncharacterized protein n=1 Tax=Oryza meyeriana var. granulata TaxID=110450 RepID=A0A6G1D8Y6_9ORYZ|nr:hypothetical protein E2562_030190 [Oryza meyeriana var. granulata]